MVTLNNYPVDKGKLSLALGVCGGGERKGYLWRLLPSVGTNKTLSPALFAGPRT